eukprot:PhF_6_TR3728/c0_g1_i1/m.5349
MFSLTADVLAQHDELIQTIEAEDLSDNTTTTASEEEELDNNHNDDDEAEQQDAELKTASRSEHGSCLMMENPVLPFTNSMMKTLHATTGGDVSSASPTTPESSLCPITTSSCTSQEEVMLTEDTHVWYFAYGSNMNVAQLLDRVGSYVERCCLRLDGYDLTFNKIAYSKSVQHGRRKIGYANLRLSSSSGNAVYGVGYKITFRQLLRMDLYEVGYDRKRVTAHTRDGTATIDCFVYVAQHDAVDEYAGLKPTENYMKDLLGCAGIVPEWYVEKLKTVPTASAAAAQKSFFLT